MRWSKTPNPSVKALPPVAGALRDNAPRNAPSDLPIT